MHKGRFIVDKSTPAPPPKRRRKLYSQEQQIEAIKAFDDNEEVRTFQIPTNQQC